MWLLPLPTAMLALVPVSYTHLDVYKRQSNDSGSSLDPALVDKVRGDLATLRKAKSAHHEFTETLKVNLAERFPGRDWTAKEILPPK